MDGESSKSTGFKPPQRAQQKNNDVTALKMECPVCLDILLPPIFLCEKGHSLCKSCKVKLLVQLCPVCRAGMTDIRNEALEKLLSKSQVSCPNDKCIYKVKADQLDDHLKECLFREFNCILGAAFGKCFWSGKVIDMLTHFKENHQENCNLQQNQILTQNNFVTHRDNKEIHLITLKKMSFIFTMKVDTRQGNANWLIQLIGSTQNAKKWLYDIEIFDSQEPQRKTKFTEVCYSDGLTCDEIITTGKCASMTLRNLDTYLSDELLTYSFNVRPLSSDISKQNANPKTNIKGKGDGNNNAGPSNNSGPPNKDGPHKPGPHKPRGPYKPGQHKPGPHKPGPSKSSPQKKSAQNDKSELKNQQAAHPGKVYQKKKKNDNKRDDEFIML